MLNRLDDPFFVTTHTRLRISTNAAGEVPRLMLVSKISSERMLDYIHMQSLKYDGQDLTAETKINAIALKNLSYWPWHNRRYDSQKYSLEFCYHGLFFYKKESEGQSRLLLCDPLRGEILKLPTIDFPVQSKNVGCSYGMGFDSKTNTHKIVCVSSDIEGCKETQVLVLGTDSWKKILSQPPCHISKKHICAYGDMHWLIDLLLQARDDRLRIVSFDFKKEEFYWTPHPTSVSMVDVPYMQLLNFRGSIAIACVSMEYYINIWVLHNYDTKDWGLDYSINLRMFSEPVGFSRLSSYSHSCGEWEHGIFFIDKLRQMSFFLDLRRTSMKQIALHKIFRGGDPWKQLNIVGYAAGSFVSLKDGLRPIG